MKQSLSTTLYFVALLAACFPSAESLRVQPNVILIVSDDAGYVDFGFQDGEGISTPHIDALAGNGVRFTHAYVTASVCSPSRAGLMTGRYQQRFGHEGNLSDPQLGLPTSESTIADEMKRLGYATVALGKWHLGFNDEYHPLRRGFDEFFGMLAGSRSYFPIEGRDPGPQAILRNHQRIEEAELTYLTDDLAVFAADYIRRDRDDPFFMFLAFNAPHTPMHATADDLTRFAEIEDEQRRTYAAMTYALDRAVGTVVASLRDVGQLDNTLILFTNDNGGATNNASDNGPLRGMKGSKWEGGVRVPLLVHWPAALEGGRTYDRLVSALDVLPTAVAAGGGEPAATLELDGVNLLPYIDGERLGDPHEVLFWRRYVAASVLRESWKLIRVASNPIVLVNLQEDPAETTNVAGDYPDIVTRLSRELEAWEAGLASPLWIEGERWERNQIRKHQMDVVGREMERRIP